MTHKESKVPSLGADDRDASTSTNGLQRPRTREDFYKFCTYILEYENYGRQMHDEDNRTSTRTPPPLDSSGSSVNSESATSSGQEEDKQSDDDSESNQEKLKSKETNEDSYDLVTCYCRKPFAGRPMIECSRCLTWVHLSCARIRRTHIPDVFYCALCKHNKMRSPRSDAVRPVASPPDSPAMKRMKRGASL